MVSTVMSGPAPGDRFSVAGLGAAAAARPAGGVAPCRACANNALAVIATITAAPATNLARVIGLSSLGPQFLDNRWRSRNRRISDGPAGTRSAPTAPDTG